MGAIAPFASASLNSSTTLIDRLEDLSALYQEQCLPSNIQEKDIENYITKNGLTEECWKILSEVNDLEEELQKQNKDLKVATCEGGHCQSISPANGIDLQLHQLSQVKENLSCTQAYREKISQNCSDDMKCVLISSALGAGGYLLEKLVPKNYQSGNCHMGDDSCITRLATGFVRAAITFFDSAWDILKVAGNKAGEKMTEFWHWVRGAEDHSSTSQLALAKASEDKKFFDRLVDDFPGTMVKIWEALVASLTEWLKSNIFCQKWSGVPHLSQCLKPTDAFNCIPCKTIVGGLCSATGTLIAEVIPSFLTGGLLTAAKHGAQGAVRIAKGFKISSKGLKAIQSSRLGTLATKSSKVVSIGKTALTATARGLTRYVLSPVRKILKASVLAVTKLVRKGRLYLAMTKTGKMLVFPGTVLKKGINVVLYPLDNPLTGIAFKAGVRAYNRAFKLGPPQLANQTVLTGSLIKKEKEVHIVLAKLEEAKISNPGARAVLKLEEKLLKKVIPIRKEMLIKSVSKDLEFNDIIKTLYPELKYGLLAKKLPSGQVMKAEQELYQIISSLPKTRVQKRLIRDFYTHVSPGLTRKKIISQKFSVLAEDGQQALPPLNFSDPAMRTVTPLLRGANAVKEQNEKPKGN
jgi:hypothetical protein